MKPSRPCRRSACALLLGLPLVLVGCADPARSGGGAASTVSPSAGEFSLLTAGPERDPFFRIRSVAPLGDSAVVVTDRSRLVVLSAEGGRVLASFGREGEGPGEFRSIEWSGPAAGDSVAVFDALRRSLTFVAPDFENSRSTALPVEGAEAVTPRCALASGEVLATVTTRSPSPREGLWEAELALYVYDRAGEGRRRVGVLTSRPRLSAVVRARQGPVRIASHLPFSPASMLRCAGHTAYWMTGDSQTVRTYRGGTVDSLRLRGLEREPITEEDRGRVRDSLLAHEEQGSLDFDRDAVGAYVSELEAARSYAFLPTAVGLRIGPDSTLWVLTPRIEGGRSKVWQVHAEDGSFVRDVRVPASFDLEGITEGRLWGTTLGPFDEPLVAALDR